MVKDASLQLIKCASSDSLPTGGKESDKVARAGIIFRHSNDSKVMLCFGCRQGERQGSTRRNNISS